MRGNRSWLAGFGCRDKSNCNVQTLLPARCYCHSHRCWGLLHVRDSHWRWREMLGTKHLRPAGDQQHDKYEHPHGCDSWLRCAGRNGVLGECVGTLCSGACASMIWCNASNLADAQMRRNLEHIRLESGKRIGSSRH
jgi:hypothetical protein